MEEARAAMLELFPEGFEERDDGAGVELAAYTDTAGEKRALAAFDDITAVDAVEGWEDRWREFHHGVRVGPLWVGPPWEQPPEGVPAVVIEPGRAFGTGAHPTTRLCLELLAELPRGSLLDVGCGSGVLAIAGAKLGFAPVHAVDLDPVAVETTIANAAANGVDVDASVRDALAAELPETGTTVANLTLDDVRMLAPLNGSPSLVTSGYLAADDVGLPGRTGRRRGTLDGWAADVWESADE
ncbi:MAG: 50S ribosomal protein L11 methyltransferase [Gaiellaceae bacterium]